MILLYKVGIPWWRYTALNKTRETDEIRRGLEGNRYGLYEGTADICQKN
jgi:hypothetical protein